jgi:hypothetical protein
MNINPNFLEIDFENIGVRNSQKRLKSLIEDVAVTPVKQYHEDLTHKFTLVEAILAKRVAKVISHWLEHKHEPLVPSSSKDMMSTLTNATKNDITLKEFYIEQVKNGIYTLAPSLALEIPDDYIFDSEELDYALIELEDRFVPPEPSDDDDVVAYDDDYALQLDEYETFTYRGDSNGYDNDSYDDYDQYEDYEDYDNYEDYDIVDEADEVEEKSPVSAFNMNSIPEAENNNAVADLQSVGGQQEFAALAELVAEDEKLEEAVEQQQQERQEKQQPQPEQQQQRAIVIPGRRQVQQAQPQAIDVNVLKLSSEEVWHMIYGMMGYSSEYIQQKMLPRWQSNPEAFEKDRRFLYELFVDTIRNAAGLQMVAGNYTFADRNMSVDQLWGYYYRDLAQNVGPQLTVARLEAAVDQPWWKRIWRFVVKEAKNISLVWVAALIIALIFDALTTYVSLDQTPMQGPIVIVFTVLLTVLFQIADLLVISYRQREFEADALRAKYRAQQERIEQALATLDSTSDSYVKLSMDKSTAHANWKAAQDSRKMARRGGFWSARIADINIIVTAYGFAFMLLDATEPMYAFYQQVNVIMNQQWELLNMWVFLMIGLAVTVSFVVNTAQRTEIMNWTMRALKAET